MDSIVPHALHPVDHSGKGHTVDFPHGQMWTHDGFRALSPLAKLCYYTAYEWATPGGFSDWGTAFTATAIGVPTAAEDVEDATFELSEFGYVTVHASGDRLFVPGRLLDTVSVTADTEVVAETAVELAEEFGRCHDVGMRTAFWQTLSLLRDRFPHFDLWDTPAARGLLITAGVH